jgi:hypothetical protein
LLPITLHIHQFSFATAPWTLGCHHSSSRSLFKLHKTIKPLYIIYYIYSINFEDVNPCSALREILVILSIINFELKTIARKKKKRKKKERKHKKKASSQIHRNSEPISRSLFLSGHRLLEQIVVVAQRLIAISKLCLLSSVRIR